jgi:serine/threonine protein kinase
MFTETRHRKAKEIFHKAISLDEGKRQLYLEQACPGDERLMQEVTQMLASDLKADALWEAEIQNEIAKRLTLVYEADSFDGTSGKLLNNRYQIESLLGEGSIGTVYRALDLQINSRPVAIKLLREQRYKSNNQKTDEWLKQKFLQEAEALSRVRHPGVIMVLDKGELADGRPFFVMEWVEGRPLRDAVKPYGMDFEQVSILVQQIGQALTAVHNKQVFHRDLKPDNIMLQSLGDGEEQAKLIDFGIAKVKDSEIGKETSITMVVGTLLYLAPEQINNQTVSAATDTYALGVIVYEMLTGRLPFNPEALDLRNAMAQLYELQQVPLQVKPCTLRASLPEAAEEAILKALSFDPTKRHQRARDFGEELAQALRNHKTTNYKEIEGSYQPLEEMKPQLAHILFMDIVEYSKRPMSQQRQIINQLQDIVRNAPAIKQARETNQVIILHTGDGMALSFFGEPLVSLECAKEIAKAMQSERDFELRMGLHTGPVYRIEDINANKNIAGGGINLAQRVMDCADAGHILLSKTYADYLIQLGDWTAHLFDLGECEVKHGVKLHLFNFYDGNIGNSNLPKKLPGKEPSPQPLPVYRWKHISVALIILILTGIFLSWKFSFDSGSTLYGTNKNVPVQDVKQRFVLSYSVNVQTFQGDKPAGKSIEMFGDTEGLIYFRNDDQIRFRFMSPEGGYLYLLNEGPQPDTKGKPVYHIMFPSTEDNDASAQLTANQQRIVPRETDPGIGFFGSTGTEKVWIIWSRVPVPRLEEVKRLNNPTDRGKITDTGQIERVQKFLKDYFMVTSVVERDVPNKRINLSAVDNCVVHLVTLAHR